MQKIHNRHTMPSYFPKHLLHMIFIMIMAVIFLMRPLSAGAETVIDVPVNQSDNYSKMNSEEFSIRMEDEDVTPGYHHQLSGADAVPTEVYARMTFSAISEIWLSIDLPMITRGTNFSSISYDLLMADQKTVICSHTRSLVSYRATYLTLFRGVLPAGTYYLRLHHFYNGDCYTTLKTRLTTEYSAKYSSIQEDDLNGSNDTRDSAAPLSGNAFGYLSYFGNDLLDWYVFDVGKEGAVLTAQRLGEGWLSFEILAGNGDTVAAKQPLYDGYTADPVKNELKEGRYYLCISYEESGSGENILNRRGGLYAINLKQNQSGQSSSGSNTSGSSASSGNSTGDSSADTETGSNSAAAGSLAEDSGSGSASLKKGAVKKISGQKYTITRLASSGKKGTVSLKTAANKKAVTVPASVKINGKIYLVTAIGANAFQGAKIRSVTIGKNVSRLAKYAFRRSKAVTVTLKTKKLTKTSVRDCLKSSKVSKILVKIGSKKVNASYVKKYKKYFTKANAGKKAAVM